MDTYPINPNDPGTLHRYLYVQGNPVNAFDPTGNEDSLADMAEVGTEIEQFAQDAGAVQKVLSGIERATEVAEGGSGVAPFIAMAVGFTSVAAAVALQARLEMARANRGCSCETVYHYTDIFSALMIYDTEIMMTSGARRSRGLPAGAYATDIAPYDQSYTQKSLKQVLYFNPSRQDSADVRAFVALCNDEQPGFHAIPNQTHQFVKEGEYPGFVPVRPITYGVNTMARGD